jgi:hypothetical protein
LAEYYASVREDFGAHLSKKVWIHKSSRTTHTLRKHGSQNRTTNSTMGSKRLGSSTDVGQERRKKSKSSSTEESTPKIAEKKTSKKSVPAEDSDSDDNSDLNSDLSAQSDSEEPLDTFEGVDSDGDVNMEDAEAAKSEDNAKPARPALNADGSELQPSSFPF